MAFDDVQLPVDIEVGAQGGPQFNTTVLTLSSGAEQRNQNWSRSKALYDIGYGITNGDDPDENFKLVLAFFYARAGRARGFRFKDWTDYSSDVKQSCGGVVDSSNKIFQLQKTYTSDSISYVRKITRPVTGTLAVYDNTTLKTLGSDYTLGALGVITFGTAPTTGHTVKATFEFDVPVRFDSDDLSLTASFNSALVQSIKLQEIIE